MFTTKPGLGYRIFGTQAVKRGLLRGNSFLIPVVL